MPTPVHDAASSPPEKRAALYTLGCRLNQAETRLLEDQLRAAGYRIVPFNEPADLGVVHGCVVTREAEAKSRKALRRFIRANPGAVAAVIGCHAQTAADALADMPGVSLVLGNDAKLQLVEALAAVSGQAAVVRCEPPAKTPFTIPFEPDGPPITRRVNLKIQDGCDCACSYCIVPRARGGSRSRVMEDILAEAAALVRRSARELVLTGVNIGAYHYNGQGLAALIDRLDRLDPKPRLRISSIEGSNVPEGLLARMADPAHALVPHLHMPLQSGSATILRAMNRPYAPEDCLAFLREAAAAVPGIGLGADVMVGFPGETDDAFQATCDLVQQGPLFYLHVFQYSERPGTAAARLPDKVPAPVMQARSRTLLAIARRKKRAFQQQWLGQPIEVLFESRKHGLWRGHAGNYLEVAVDADANLENQFATVVCNAVQDDLLQGRLVGPAGARP